MAIVDTLLPEYDREMGITRKLLERVPDDQLAWKPHDKSMTLGRLASHLAELPGWAVVILNEGSFDLGGAMAQQAPRVFDSRAEVLDTFDRNVASTRQAIATKTDGELTASWTLKRDGREMFTAPKVSVLKGFLVNHSIHHRGQLSVYLRLRDVPVPAIYGPSADERG